MTRIAAAAVVALGLGASSYLTYVHYASFAAFALSLGHALWTGTDLRGVGGPLLALVAAGPVLWLTFYRLLTPRTPVAAPAPA